MNPLSCSVAPVTFSYGSEGTELEKILVNSSSLFLRGDSLTFHLWPLLLKLGCPGRSLDLVSDASEVSDCIILQLLNDLYWALLHPAPLSLALSLPPSSFPFLNQIFFKECGLSRSSRADLGCERFHAFLCLWQTLSLALCRSFQFSPLLLSHLLNSG